MDRREYQREYMRKWRARQAKAPAPWTIRRMRAWLAAMERYAQGNMAIDQWANMADVKTDFDNFVADLAKTTKNPEYLSDNAAKTG